ncbi:MAG: zf-HC2 domain-containing protein [Ilumatobacteraceae bacterium]|nr:zf-HC2 domain-containing protein [Ilumatobacteraceae bacterium]
MANCRETIRELDAFLDDELPDDVRRHIHAHLGDCVDCHQAFDFQAELKLAIRRKCSNDEMPAGLLGRIEQCFDEDFDGDGIIGATDDDLTIEPT